MHDLTKVGIPQKKEQLSHAYRVIKDVTLRVGIFACVSFVLIGALPVIGVVNSDTKLVSMGSSFLITSIGLVLNGFDDVNGLVYLGVAIVAGFMLFGSGFLVYPSVAALILGLGFILSGMIQMGGDALFLPMLLTPPSKAGPLITQGAFKFVRHPMYFGLVLLSFSLAALTDSPERAVASLFLFPILHEQIKVEEQLLREQYGDEYDNYATKVKATLVPFISEPLADVPGSGLSPEVE